MIRALGAALLLAAIVFVGAYALNELIWDWIPGGSNLFWAAVIAVPAGVFTFVDQYRHA